MAEEELNKQISSLAPECNKLKFEYDDCFKKWYQGYLKGEKLSLECEEKFRKYRSCLEPKIKGSQLECQLKIAQEKSPFSNGGRPLDK